MNGVFETINLPLGEQIKKGIAVMTAFEIPKDAENSITNMRLVMDGGWLFRLVAGKYVKLSVDGEMMMSDTPMERISNRDFVSNANGRIFIAGLGIGLIVNALKGKVESGEVTHITIVEKFKDVVDLVAPYYADMPITYIIDDVLTMKPARGVIYDTIYFDIWPKISEDNLPEIAKLHNRFKYVLNRTNPRKWMGSWMQKYLQNQRAKDRRSGWGW